MPTAVGHQAFFKGDFRKVFQADGSSTPKGWKAKLPARRRGGGRSFYRLEGWGGEVKPQVDSWNAVASLLGSRSIQRNL